MLRQYFDLKADVRHDGNYHQIRQLVQPNDEEVRAVARVLVQADDFIAATQDFVDSFTTYQQEIGDYWATPSETMSPRCPVCTEGDLIPLGDELYRCNLCGWQGVPARVGDCDDKAILTCSILRNYIPAEHVFCAVGDCDGIGHMWVVLGDLTSQDRIVEATAPSSRPVKGHYRVGAIFNDCYTFAYPWGVKDFCLVPVTEEKEVIYA